MTNVRRGLLVDGDKISLKEYFEKLLNERDLFYLEKIKYLETRIVSVDDKHTVAVEAAKLIAKITFDASEKAIQKSEEGQRELNIKNNEFRGQLKDQAEHLMPRTESMANWKNVSEKVIELKEQTEIKFDLVRKEIQVLREYRSEGGGRSAGAKDVRDYVGWILALLLGILALAQYIK